MSLYKSPNTGDFEQLGSSRIGGSALAVKQEKGANSYPVKQSLFFIKEYSRDIRK
jgi:hypothetical protein